MYPRLYASNYCALMLLTCNLSFPHPTVPYFYWQHGLISFFLLIWQAKLSLNEGIPCSVGKFYCPPFYERFHRVKKWMRNYFGRIHRSTFGWVIKEGRAILGGKCTSQGTREWWRLHFPWSKENLWVKIPRAHFSTFFLAPKIIFSLVAWTRKSFFTSKGLPKFRKILS